ncbi:hypothetical protein BN961_03643 [Afipia felis]|uniref:Uncharacterized protein n=1 Tax=Afipia felis TaxID=1035 RepID=A0A090MS97_AFIFE|nr:hypothetical protein BN961_03643 [Afipia felis]
MRIAKIDASPTANEEIVGDDGEKLERFAVHIVLDYDLHADFHVQAARDDEERQQDGNDGRSEKLRGGGLIASGQHQDDDRDRDDQQRHRNGRDALAEEIGGAGMGGAEAAHTCERGAHGNGFAGVACAHRPAPIR